MKHLRNLGIILAVLLVLALTTKAEFTAETIIDAPPEKVWEVLMATEAYPDWNPTFVRIDGAFEDGEVTNHVLFPDGEIVAIATQVAEATAPNTLKQSGGVPLLLTFENEWTLTSEGTGTRARLYEVNNGLYLWLWDESWVEPAYQKVAEALKLRAEAL
ncbi:MAG: SRPBCC family protein [Pseudomonadota bacterium]